MLDVYSGQWLPPRTSVEYDKIFATTTRDTIKKATISVPDGLFDPIKIIVNGPATIVFWKDGTKTVVKCAKGESWDIYRAFTAALAKKVYGNNSKIKKILKTKVEYQKED